MMTHEQISVVLRDLPTEFSIAELVGKLILVDITKDAVQQGEGGETYSQEQILCALTNLPVEFSIGDLLRELFPPVEQAWYDEWNEIAARFKSGTEVTGLVVHKAPFGDFIEIGAGEPALLEIISMPTLTPEQYQSGEYNQLGSTVKAWVLGLASRGSKQLRLTQDPSTDFDTLLTFYKT